jgi:hypothetical protein
MTRALMVIALRGNMFVPRHTVGLASHIRHGNFGEVWTEKLGMSRQRQ